MKEIKKDLGEIKSILRKHDKNFETLAIQIMENQKLIRENWKQIGENQKLIGGNQKQIGGNQKQIGENRKQIGENRKQIMDNKKGINKNTVLLERQEDKIDQVLELMEAHVAEKPAPEEIESTLENHQIRIEALETRVREF